MTDTFLPLDGGGEVGVKGSCLRNFLMRHYAGVLPQKHYRRPGLCRGASLSVTPYFPARAKPAFALIPSDSRPVGHCSAPRGDRG
jgi:hypothetical protein